MSLQARTQGLSLAVDDALRGVLALGLLEAENAVLGALPPAFAEERDQLTARLTARLAGKSPADIPGVAETRALFHQLDLDPTKTRPSSFDGCRRIRPRAHAIRRPASWRSDGRRSKLSPRRCST